MAEKRLVDANELEEKAIYITGPKGSACHAVPLGLIQAAPTIDPETLRPTAHIIRGYVPETKDGVFCDGCNHCLGWEYGAHVIGYFIMHIINQLRTVRRCHAWCREEQGK